jgi:hypothetical protein
MGFGSIKVGDGWRGVLLTKMQLQPTKQQRIQLPPPPPTSPAASLTQEEASKAGENLGHFAAPIVYPCRRTTNQPTDDHE